MGFLRLLHYPGELEPSGKEIYGASAHSDYGMITLLATDGVQGLQVCREKSKQPQVWEDVPSLHGSVHDGIYLVQSIASLRIDS
ncbi:hypothetical protein SLEP1_g8933 [Rubroshorea leprosula]|nr:hypothetical protein SLEP1_g8933 [Rubroshorea leprosula]